MVTLKVVRQPGFSMFYKHEQKLDQYLIITSLYLRNFHKRFIAAELSRIMSNRVCYVLSLLVFVSSCSTDSKTETATTKNNATSQRQVADHLHIPFSNPVLIDSSTCVMYPLSLNEILMQDEDKYGSSSSSRSETYWNMIFYNVRNGATHLLNNNRKMVIQSYSGNNPDNTSTYTDQHHLKTFGANALLYYMITTTDFNHDGELTNEDPTYLFISDKAGYSFKQISPDSFHITDWKIQEATGEIFMQAIQDSNYDHKFGDNDETIPYIYNISTKQLATRVFDDQFTKMLKLNFQQHWPKKK